VEFGERDHSEMSENAWIEAYMRKATESLTGAQNEYDNRRFNNSANRAYYAAFQASISALIRDGIWRNDGNWPHTFVQSEFAGRLINRRHRYPPGLRSTLSDLQRFRHRADYRHASITRTDANTAVRQSREFVEAVRAGSGRQ